VALEEVVLFAASAVGAFQAAADQYGHAYRDQNGEYVAVHSQPMYETAHRPLSRAQVRVI
jgi:hypothetical protein